MEVVITKTLPISQIQIGLCPLEQLTHEPLPQAFSYSQKGAIGSRNFQSFGSGDIIGIFTDNQTAFFTLNGLHIGPKPAIKLDGPMKIGICLTCQGDTVKFVQNNFLFDIQAHLQNKAQASISDILKEPRIDAGPLVRDYLRHMGYSETIACLTIKDTTDVYIHRKNTIDAAAKGKLETLEQLEEKTESAESEAVISETQSDRKSVADEVRDGPLPFTALGADLTDNKLLRSRTVSAVQTSNYNSLVLSKDQLNLVLRGELRKFLSSGRISQAKDFAQHNNLQLDQTSLIALDFLNRYIKGHDYLELLTDRNFEGTIPTTQGPQSSQVLMSLLCYTSVEEAVCSSAGYLLSSEQQMLLVDHLCAKGGPSRIEYLVKSLAVLQRILTS